MSSPKHSPAAAVIVLLLLAAAHAVTQDAPSRPTFRTGVNIVRVDAIVTDRRGDPVADLTAADFEIIEDGKPQAIEQFRLVEADGQPGPDDPPLRTIRDRDDEAMEASREDVRIFAILLADYQVCWERTEPVREALTRFIRTQLGPRDLVAVMSPLTSVRTLTFTYDHEEAVREIRQFTGRKGEYTPRNVVEEEQFKRGMGGNPGVMEAIRDAVVRDALTALAVRVGSMRDGRKSIVFVSEGFRSAFGSMALDLREITKDANRHNASIYPFDARGFAPLVAGGSSVRPGCPRGGSRDTLRNLADDTDGRAIVDTNTFTEGFAQIVRDSSSYYLLGYTPTASHKDGKFHPITVRVKRPNTDVRARKGYWAPTVEDERRAANPTPDLEKPVLDALATLAPPVQDGRYGRTWIGTARGDGGRTRVTVVWEPLTQSAAARREQPARVSLKVSDGGGAEVFFAPGGDPADAANRRFVFDAPPGKIELRLTLEGGAGETLDREIRAMELPDLTRMDATITTPRVFRGRTARELQNIAADPATMPVVAREFARTERLLIRFDVYEAAGAPAQPTAAVLNRNGEKMFDVPVAAATAGGTHQIDLGLASTPGGEYLLEILLRVGRTPARQLVAFRVR